ncbi:MAG: hypothetical protein AAGH46_10790 [Bacteroidota bacterium]
MRTAYYRDIVRPKILTTKPVFADDNSTCEIHVLTSSKDWINLIWGLKSLYHFTQRQYALCIHGDTSLSPENQQTLQEHFPQARIINRATADPEVLDWLSPYPLCQEFRRTNHLAPKVFDFLYYLNSDRMFLFDSDILFFAEPTILLNRLEDSNYTLNTVNTDVDSAYTVTPQVVREKLGFNLVDRFNSGLGLIHEASLNLDWLEEFLHLPGIIGYFWRIEQTLFALSSSRFGVELLPSEYDVRLDRGIHNCPSRHYVGRIRHLMYREGMENLMQQRFSESLS